jgi:hypothetical protein
MSLSLSLSLADWLSVIALVVSVVTFFITTYEQYWKRPRLSLVLGDSISLSYGPEYSGLALWACVVVANQGAADAVILRIEGTLTRADGWKAPIVWIGFGKYQDQVLPGKPFEPSFAFVDWAEALVSPSRKASTSWIAFSGAIPDKLTPGSYRLRLNVVTQPRRRSAFMAVFGRRARRESVACWWAGSFEISGAGASHLEAHCVGTPDRTVPDTYNVHLTGNTTRMSPGSPTATLGGLPEAPAAP